jgi:hypothetical protein
MIASVLLLGVALIAKRFFLALALIVGQQSTALAAPTITDGAVQVMDFAERTFPSLFPHGPATETTAALLFRSYPNGMILAVAVNNRSPLLVGHVYVAGGAFGTEQAPSDVGLLTNFIAPVDSNPPPVSKTIIFWEVAPNFPTHIPFGSAFLPLPPSEAKFCADVLPLPPAVASLFPVGARITVFSCTFANNTGFVGLTGESLSSGVLVDVPLVIMYEYE